jgi:uroporphyrinogen-III synthase
MEQNGWEALKTKMVCVGIKTKELLEANGFTVCIWITLLN